MVSVDCLGRVGEPFLHFFLVGEQLLDARALLHVRVTSRADYYEEHSESVELWSAGSPCFPPLDTIREEESVHQNIAQLLASRK